jgi:hypothetical protein
MVFAGFAAALRCQDGREGAPAQNFKKGRITFPQEKKSWYNLASRPRRRFLLPLFMRKEAKFLYAYTLTGKEC